MNLKILGDLLKTKIAILIIAYILLALALYTYAIKDLSDLPIHNMRELGRSGRMQEITSRGYTYFMQPYPILLWMPLIPILFALLYPRKLSYSELLFNVSLLILSWIALWELIIKALNILPLQYTLEGYSSSSLLFFGGIDMLVTLPLSITASLVGTSIIHFLKRSVTKR